MRNIEVIAEASKKIPQDIKNGFNDIPWRQISAMRNKIIHEYFGVDLQAIWNVASYDLKELKSKIILIRDSKDY